MQKILYLLFPFCVIGFFVYGQELLRFDGGCSYEGDTIKAEVYSFESGQQAEEALRRVMKHTGLPSNFIIKAADVANAQARIIGSQRYILYNQMFMLNVKNETETDWAAISILAHEIGHHLSGHTLDGLGSRPSKELEADRFSGFVLAKMGSSLEDALIAMNKIASDQGSYTHPPKSARLAAITNGWVAAKDILKEGTIGNLPIKEKKENIPTINTHTLPVEKKVIVASPSIGTLNAVTVDHNEYLDGKKGMLIHVSFDVEEMKDQKGRVTAYFYYRDGTPLTDFNGIYCTKNGKVSSGNDFTPSYDNTTYDDLQIFLPYSELHLRKGFYELLFTVSIWKFDPSGNIELVNSEDVFFTYTSR